MSLDPARRSALLGIKLAALVNDQVGAAPIAASTFAGGAALTRLGEAWVLADERPDRVLGPALVWARRQPDVAVLNVLVDGADAAGISARRAELFTNPIRVWQVNDRTLSTAVVAPVSPSPEVLAEMLALAGEIAAAGADPLSEWGVLVGEVEGLEVCRVVRRAESGVAVLEVGVGAHDREAFAMVHGDRPPLVALQGVVDAVAPHRQPGSRPHALNRIAPERLLRAALINRPDLINATRLQPADPPVPRPNLKDPVPCVAVGIDEAGHPITVVCSVGIDLDLVPFAADAHLRHGGALVVVTPTRDAHPVTRELLALLKTPARLVLVDI